MTVNEALVNALEQAKALGADYLTISDAQGELVGVYSAEHTRVASA